METVLLIPAYKPLATFPAFVKSLIHHELTIVVVDDGSGIVYQEIFDELEALPGVVILRHETNKGKGAALKTGFEFVLAHGNEYRQVVTADADGQHRKEDIIKMVEAVKQNPDALVLGVRSFDGAVPLRSRIGNVLTKAIFRAFFSIRISDTQSGLRGIQLSMVSRFVSIPFNRYEYETEMLLVSSRASLPIKEIPIQTVYENRNASSHFNPFLDSLKIYYVLFRYTLMSLTSATVDFLIFTITYPWIGSVLLATYAARSVSLCVNYGLNSKKVFFSAERARRTFPPYLLLVIVSGFISSLIIDHLHVSTGLSINWSKVIAESLLYVVNFFIQSQFIFKTHRV